MPPISSAVAFAVPDGASCFASLWSSTISALRKCAAASRAKRIISTAPIEKFGATKSAQPVLLGERTELGRLPAGRAHDAGDALLEGGADVRRRCVRSREVDGGGAAGHVGLVAELDPAHLVPGGLEPAHDRTPRLALRAEERDLHAAACSLRLELARPTAARNWSSSGPTPAAASRSGGSSTPASSASSSASTASISAITRSSRQELGVGHERLPEPAHPVRGRFEREDDPALEALLRALQLALAKPAGSDLADLLGADLDTRGEVLLARADVDAEDAGVGVLRPEAVDGVRHPALLADLLEEPRRGGPAEDRVEQGRGEAAAVRARDAGRAEAEVVLLGVLALEAKPGAGGAASAAGGRACPARAGAPAFRSLRCSSATRRSCSRFPAAATTTLPGEYAVRW